MTRTAYSLLLYLLLPFTPLKLLWRSRKQPEYLRHWGERYGFYKQAISQPVIWLHCVSVGETRAAAPLVALLKNYYPQHQILLTHTTPTGRATSEQLFGDSVLRAYLPYDVPCAVGRFLTHFKPSISVLMETELWFNVIAGCKQRNIPVLLVNARLSAKSANGYAKLGKLVKEGLQNLTAIAAQTKEDAKRLESLGAHDVGVAGNMKFDVVPPDDVLENGKALRAAMNANKRPVFLAASTRSLDGNQEESLILDAIAKANIPDLLTVIVPRHPQRFDEVAELLKSKNCNFARRSALSPKNDKPFVLGDSMGEMFSYYTACDLTLIGGSLLPLGGQNLIEACAVGKPVLIGQHTFNFEQASKQAIECGAAKRVQDSDDLAKILMELFKDRKQLDTMANAALNFANANRGATERIAELIKQTIS